MPEWTKGGDCKSPIREFESHHHLNFFIMDEYKQLLEFNKKQIYRAFRVPKEIMEYESNSTIHGKRELQRQNDQHESPCVCVQKFNER